MEIPSEFHNQVQNILADEAYLTTDNCIAASRRKLWAVILGLRPVKDGDQWCVLWGPNLEEGIAAFGETPEGVMEAFEEAMKSKKGGMP